jgi:hypothetical protein
MAKNATDDITYIRRWIKKGLSKDGKTLDFSNKKIGEKEAIDFAENIQLEGLEILFLHNCQIKDICLE